MATPLFSVVVTTYNRERIVRRCVDSCLAQSCGDLEVVVVDDASSDGTVAALEGYEDPRLRVVVHERNRGINPARHTGTVAARGEWVVVVDSDWELMPEALERLRVAIERRPDGVRVIRFRLRWDDGSVTPRFVPAEPFGYEGRIRWAEEEGGEDAGRCIQAAVFEATPYIADRRGAMEWLYELDLAKAETTLCLDEVLGMEHSDAPNSWLRSTKASELLPRLRTEAPDMLWMAETVLERHGEALRRWGPRQYADLLRIAAMQSFLLGRRRAGVGYALRALRARPLAPIAWVTLVLGVLGPAAVGRGTLALRRLQALRA
ncbi:MAG TPA: glycosyltransferase family 2 protein [Solirubrobacterales bacterium]|nr:glycosyltransferase family 2 protein [Solirubrobacterales bacterium]